MIFAQCICQVISKLVNISRKQTKIEIILEFILQFFSHYGISSPPKSLRPPPSPPVNNKSPLIIMYVLHKETVLYLCAYDSNDSCKENLIETQNKKSNQAVKQSAFILLINPTAMHFCTSFNLCSDVSFEKKSSFYRQGSLKYFKSGQDFFKPRSEENDHFGFLQCSQILKKGKVICTGLAISPAPQEVMELPIWISDFSPNVQYMPILSIKKI